MLAKATENAKQRAESENGEFLPKYFAHISEETHKALGRSILKENDILFSIAGALWRVAIVPCNVLPANINQALAIIRVKKDSGLNDRFLYQFLKSERVQKHIEKINVQAAQANISLGDISGFKIRLPIIQEQRKIAVFLSFMDKEIELLSIELDMVKMQKKGLMQKLLTGKIRVKETRQ